MVRSVRVCAFTSICEEDHFWIPQYLAEAERLNLPFVIHFDRCGPITKTLKDHRLCVGHTEQNYLSLEFTEQHKQAAFDLVSLLGFDWALAWDMDETYEKGAGCVLSLLNDPEINKFDCLDTPWFNLWNDPAYIRVDNIFCSGHRVKLYNLQDETVVETEQVSGKKLKRSSKSSKENIFQRRWVFDHPITNGCKLQGREARLGKLNLTCLHWGMLTKEMREQHRQRWDRIYTAAVGANPYGFWNVACDETITPVLVRHGYF